MGFAQAVGWDKIYMTKINRWAPLRRVCHFCTYSRTLPPKKLQLAASDNSVRPAPVVVPVTSSLRAASLFMEQQGPHHACQHFGKLGGNDLWHHLRELHLHGVSLDEGAQAVQVDLLDYLWKEDTPTSRSANGGAIFLSLLPLHKGPSTSCMASISLVRW